MPPKKKWGEMTLAERRQSAQVEKDINLLAGERPKQPRCRHDGTETSVHENGRHYFVCQQCGRRRVA